MYYVACSSRRRFRLDVQQLMRPRDMRYLVEGSACPWCICASVTTGALPYLVSSRGLPYLVRSRGQCLPLVHLCKRDHRGAALRLALEVRRRSKELGGYVLPRHLRVKLRVVKLARSGGYVAQQGARRLRAAAPLHHLRVKLAREHIRRLRRGGGERF
jgi:hypothetical protein